jgi:DNA repair protein RadB
MVNKISAGSFDLNKWLFGGYEKDIITMVAGGPGSGKTNFSLLAACSQAKKGNKVIFIDTEGGFSVERVKQIVGEDYKGCLDNILLLEPTNFEEQKMAFDKLLKTLKKEHVGLIVVDGMAMLYRLELGDARDQEAEVAPPGVPSAEGKINKVNRAVAKQMRCLAEIARKQKIPVLITNQVYAQFVKDSDENWKSGFDKEFNIVGGDLFKYWSKCIIELKRDGSKRKAVLLKHRSLEEKEMGFVIKDAGIFKKGLF